MILNIYHTLQRDHKTNELCDHACERNKYSTLKPCKRTSNCEMYLQSQKMLCKSTSSLAQPLLVVQHPQRAIFVPGSLWRSCLPLWPPHLA